MSSPISNAEAIRRQAFAKKRYYPGPAVAYLILNPVVQEIQG